MKTLFVILITAVFSLWNNARADQFDASIHLSPLVELSMPVSGLVEMVKVRAGQQVKKGETLIALDEAPFKADLDLAQSHVAFHQARLDETRRDLNNQQELYDRTVLSTVELENAQLMVRRHEALLASAKARLARVNYDYSVSRLKAPFDAFIMAVMVNEGQAVNNAIQSKTLLTLVRQGYFIARFNVTAGQLEKIKIETPVQVVIGNTDYPARVSAIAYEPVQLSNSTGVGREQHYTVEAGFYTDENLIAAGKKANVIID